MQFKVGKEEHAQSVVVRCQGKDHFGYSEAYERKTLK
jgi:hypothetical protein